MERSDHLIDEALRRQALAVDSYTAEDIPAAGEIWQAINIRRKKKHQARIRKIWAVAATVLLLITALPAWYHFRQEAPAVVKVSVAPALPTENDAIAYIRNMCAGNNIACSSPDFKQLKEELDESSTALSDIDQQISLFGDSETLLRAKIRIENHQARIIRSMLQIL